MIDDCGAIGMWIGRGNRNTWRKPTPVPLCPPQIPHDLTRARTRAAAVGSLSYDTARRELISVELRGSVDFSGLFFRAVTVYEALRLVLLAFWAMLIERYSQNKIKRFLELDLLPCSGEVCLGSWVGHIDWNHIQWLGLALTWRTQLCRWGWE
jgi:hypothetical protein